MLKKLLSILIILLLSVSFSSCGDTGIVSVDADYSSALDGLKIVIDAGHGGYDNGAQGAETKVAESVVNLAIAKELKAVLQEYGVTVVMTREDEYAVASQKDRDMAKRAEIIAEANADMMVSIHQNIYEDSSVKGPQVFFLSYGGEAEKLAKAVQAAMNERLDVSSPRKALNENYMILKSGSQPSIIVECGFLSNPDEEKLLLDEDYQKKIAQAITAGIVDYIKGGISS